MKKQDEQHEYTLHLTKRQVELLSFACDRMSRIICGQDWTYQEFMEQAWEKRCREAVGGNGFDKEWDGGWQNMREDAEAICKQIKRRFWGLGNNELYGIRYDDVADVLFDIHQVLRHQLWIDNGMKTRFTVDSDEAMRFGKEPLADIHRNENKKEEE